MAKFILGISAFYHDSAAAILQDDKVVAAAQEERFTRIKHDAAFPIHAIVFCLNQAKIEVSDLTSVVFYEKPILKFERILETYLKYAPRGFLSFAKAAPIWTKEKLFLKRIIRKELEQIANDRTIPPLFFSNHHLSHAASAFYPSHFEEAAILCLDGVGEWTTTSCWRGKGNSIEPIWEIEFPHSIGLLYSAFTFYCGFKVNSGEYKLMGLAPYGKPTFKSVILENLITINTDGSFRLNLNYFAYEYGLKMVNSRFERLFGQRARLPDEQIESFHMDLARSIQEVTEEVLLRIAQNIRETTQQKFLCLAGGVALNCVANGKLRNSEIFDDFYIQPASGDAGGSIGAAMALYHQHYGEPRKRSTSNALSLSGSYLGPSFEEQEIEKSLIKLGAHYTILPDRKSTTETTAKLIAESKIVGWFQGRAEFGPRALGARSILADARQLEMQSKLNLKIKYRESFRPFAPAVIAEKADKWFKLRKPSPFMLETAEIADNIKNSSTPPASSGFEKLKFERSSIPAATHVDYSARVQTVHKETNPLFWELLQQFESLTGCPLILNTSFNVRGEPIVNSPEEAYSCFINTEMDYLIIGSYFLSKREQPEKQLQRFPKQEFSPD